MQILCKFKSMSTVKVFHCYKYWGYGNEKELRTV